MAMFLICFIFMPILAAAAPQVNFPLNLQFPPIAYVEELFEFQFAPTTFAAGSDRLQYSLNDGPTWLSLGAANRTLSGTPGANDAGTVNFTITAAGGAGPAATMQSELLVSSDIAPTISKNVSAILSTAGPLSGKDTIVLKPSEVFSISFPVDTFESTGKKLSYYAMLADHTPLPAWIGLDASSIQFTGTTPSPQAPQTFEILLIASDTPGFAATSLSFSMVISNHTLAFEPFHGMINIAVGEEVRITDTRTKLFLDGTPIQDMDIKSAKADLPSWLTFDNTTLDITGKAPAEIAAQDLSIIVEDQLGDSATYTLHLVVQSDLFVSGMDNLNVTLGVPFVYSVSRSILTNDDEAVSIDFGLLSTYLKFDPKVMTISGTVPESFKPQDVKCSITAESGNGTLKDTQNFEINVVDQATANSPSGGNALDADKQAKKVKWIGTILGSVVGALCGVALLVALILCLRRRRKNAKSYVSPKLPRSPRKSDISRPTFIPYGWPDIDVSAEDDLEKGKEEKAIYKKRTEERPPALQVVIRSNRQDSHDLTESDGDDIDTKILDDLDMSLWGIDGEAAPSQHPHNSMKIATDLAKRNSSRSDTFRKHKRRATTVYQDQIHRSSGLPVRRRITGMGHGRQTYSPSRNNTNFSAYRRHPSTSSFTTRRTSTFSTVPSAFAQSPAARKHTTFVITPTEERRSIRAIRASRRGSLADRRTIDEKRSSYIRKRASAQSPFFSAGYRASSSSYKSPPAFIAEALPKPREALSPISRNTIVRPDDDVVVGEEKEIPSKFGTVKPPSDMDKSPKDIFPGSLRKNRANRPYTTLTPTLNRVNKEPKRPGTAIMSSIGGFTRRASTRQSLRAYDLKASLNDLTGSRVFEDAEMSDSVYSGEEKDIEEAEKRKTIKASDYRLPPLNLNSVDTARNNRRLSKAEKRKSNRDSKRELKRTSERDPTPYYCLASSHEHGGKENASSTYNLGHRSSPTRPDPKGKARVASSPERPKPVTTLNSRPAAEARRSQQASVHRASQALSARPSNAERHSRRSLHSRTQSRHSVPKKRAHSRSQSSAYPYFDTAIFESLNAAPRLSTDNAKSTATPLPASTTKNSLVIRDLSGNLTFYGVDEEPTIEGLDSSSIAFRSSNGQLSRTARMSRLASLHLSSQTPPMLPHKSSKRETVVPLCTASGHSAGGLGLYPMESPSDVRAREREAMHGGAAAAVKENGPKKEEAKEKDGENGNGNGNGSGNGNGNGNSRKTWGSLKSMMGRGSRWVSGGYWDKQGKEDKVFI
ncbi:polarity establishment/cellular polarization [Coniothyrium glycines]